jgi:hypothetical protein
MALLVRWPRSATFQRVVDNGSDDPTVEGGAAVTHGAALDLAGDDPAVLANAAYSLAYFGEDIGAMMALIDRALTINRAAGTSVHFAPLGRPSLHRNRTCQCRAAPQPPRSSGLVISNHRRRTFRQSPLRRRTANIVGCHPDDPGFPTVYRFLAACYAHLGRFAEPHETIA